MLDMTAKFPRNSSAALSTLSRDIQKARKAEKKESENDSLAKEGTEEEEMKMDWERDGWKQVNFVLRNSVQLPWEVSAIEHFEVTTG